MCELLEFMLYGGRGEVSGYRQPLPDKQTKPAPVLAPPILSRLLMRLYNEIPAPARDKIVRNKRRQITHHHAGLPAR
jgi:hypothetical protein